MGIWRVDADLLARSRFGVSAMVETVAALHRPAHGPPGAVAADLVRRAPRGLPGVPRVRPAGPRPSCRTRSRPAWVADFLTVAPPRLGHGLRGGAGAGAGAAGGQGAPGPASRPGDAACRPCCPTAGRDALAGGRGGRPAVGLVRRPSSRSGHGVERVLQADVVSRTARLAASGWAGAVDDMRVGTRWLGEGRLQINTFDYPPRDLAGAEELYFIPAHCRSRGWVVWDQEVRYGLVYPVTGRSPVRPRARRRPSARLLGRGRAEVLDPARLRR